MSLNDVTIILRGEPVAMGRARGTKSGAFYTPAKTREAMRALRYAGGVMMGDRKPLEGPLRASMVFCFPWPKATSKKRRAAEGGHWKTERPDYDNLAKLVGDALNGIVWVDDAQLCWVIIHKLKDEIPRIEIRVTQCELERSVPERACSIQSATRIWDDFP